MDSKRTKNSTQTTTTAALKIVDSATTETLIPLERPEMANGDLGKVQELLFGQQLSTTTRQLDALQKRLDQQLADSNTLLMTHISDLGKECALRFDTLTKELQMESNNRRERDSQAEQGLHATESNLREYIKAVDNRIAKADNALQADLQNARSHWSSTLESTREQLLQQLNDTAETLQARKLDRQALSGLLGTIASDLASNESASFNESAESISVYSRD